MSRIRLLNGSFDPLSMEGAVDAIFQQIKEGRRGWVCTVNVAILMMMRRMPRLQSFVDKASLIVADGQPLIWIAPWFGKPLPERVTGVDLVESLCERAEREHIGIYLLGATDKVVCKVAARLQRNYPNLKVDLANGYFSNDEFRTRAEAVRESGARILFVGMGVPRQEYFLEEQWEQLGVDVAVGVGGSFDVLAGLRRRAPKWMQKVGLEWFYRLIQEPRRLFMRYLVTNSRFVYLVLKERLKRN